MTAKTLIRSIKTKKPAIIRERGVPRYVILDWETWRAWEDVREDMEDAARLVAALADPQNRRRVPYSRVKKLLKLS